MMKPLSEVVQLIGNVIKSKKHLGIIRNIRQLNTPTVKEVNIPTDWGYIAGKWWGDENTQPILAMHGWQDNAGTWDTLIPLLPPEYSVLAIDFPGHGLSTPIPKGAVYWNWQFVQCIQLVMEHYKFDKISFLGHSLGSIIAFRYTSCFNDKVNFYIAVENIIPDVPGTPEKLHKRITENLQKLLVDQKRFEQEPPSYPYDEAIMRYHLGTWKNVNLETAHHLVDRGTRKSKIDPTKYYFSRDSRLKHIPNTPESPEFLKYQSLQVQCPLLHIKATGSRYATDELAICCHQLLAENNERYELLAVPGSHHVHLNNPELLAPKITEFLNKYAKVERISQST